MAEVVIFEYAKIENFAFNNQYGMYTSGVPSDSVFEIGKSYTVVWDDVEYTCAGQDMSALMEGAVSVGNLSAFGGVGNDEPFVIASAAGGFLFGSFDTKTDHWVGIVTEIHAPNDVVIQNYSQTEVPYTNVPKVWLKSPNSTPNNLVLVPFSYGEAVENIPISLDFSAGDQRVTAEDGYLVKSAVIQKPADLVAENVRRGKVIAGIEGDFVGDTEEITVDGDNDLTFAGGDFVVEPSSAEKVISKVTISPPSELVPANIAKGVAIAGVVGTHEGGGSAEFNIAYGDTAPDDTSKLWVKCEDATELIVSPVFNKYGTLETLPTKLPIGVYNVACAAVGDKIYVFGGYGDNGYDNFLKTINVFDPANNTIETLSVTLPYGAEGIGCAAVGDKIYLFGGREYSCRNTISVFNTTNNTVETLSATLPTAAYDMGCAAVGDKIYLFGGFTDAGRLKTINVFDTTNHTIGTLSATLPIDTGNIGCAAVGDKIYLVSGYGGSHLDTINEFDTTNNTIKTLSTKLPTAQNASGCATMGGKVYLFGGASSSSKQDIIRVFDPTKNTVETLSATIPEAATSIGCETVGDKIYLFGGTGTTTHYFKTINVYASASYRSGSVYVVTSGDKNLFSLLPNVDSYVSEVYRVGKNGVADLVDAFVFAGGKWKNILPCATWSVESVSGATYGFELSGDYYVSKNKGVTNSYAICKVVINAKADCTAVFNCINYAEANYDFGILSTLDQTLTLSATADSSNVYKSFKGLSYSTVQTVEYNIPVGEHFVYVKFRKDGSGNSYNDTLQFNVTFKE